METTQDILLNSSLNKASVNENVSLNIALSGNRKLLPEDAISDTLNAYDIFLSEREKSNKFRLILSINPYCTNVLFNPFTEIVKNEGSPDVVVLNYLNEEKNVEGVVGKSENFNWVTRRKNDANVPSNYEAIRDTQLSNDNCGFEYHCGIDIFNNHILRSKTFKAVNYNETNSKQSIGNLQTNVYGNNYSGVTVNEPGASHVYIDDNFNTIDDYMRDRNGYVISEYFPKIVSRADYWSNDNYRRNTVLPLHLYQNYDISSFEECVNDKLIENDGWYGFSNPATINNVMHRTVTKNGIRYQEERELNINKTINNKRYCDFIDMYPDRKLYSFKPLYNEHRKRLENNWNYCLTYPSESVIKMDEFTDFPFFRIDSSGKTALKVYMFDEGTVDDDGTNLLTIYSICQHGLKEGDTVNIYKSDDLFYDEVEVVRVVSKYIFQVFKDTGNMSDKWLSFEDRTVITDVYGPKDDTEESTEPIGGDNPNVGGEGTANGEGSETSVVIGRIERGLFIDNGGNIYPICESNRCNIDPNAQDISFRRVVNGVECEYYVRKFSRLPNFKFKDEEINDYTLYDDYHVKNEQKKRRFDDDLPLIKRFSKPGDKTCEYENHIAKLGFANTSYSDDVVEIVYTDDIDTSYLKDNLGRPLSDIYFTIVKNNKGYKEWYGIRPNYISPTSIDVEYSHCFGKNNSSFLLSDYYREMSNIRNTELDDVRDITATNEKGLKIFSKDVVKNQSNLDADELIFDNTWSFYGDICCYSPVDCDEQSIQMSMNRFNTVQRELKDIKGGAYSFMYFNEGKVVHDEIQDVENNLIYARTNNGDPYNDFNNGNLNHTVIVSDEGIMNLREGYYYQAHYRIPLKTVSQSLSTDNGFKFEIVDIKKESDVTSEDRILFEFKTALENNFLKNDKAVLYKRSTNEYYFITVYDINSSYRFNCVINDESGNTVNDIDGMTDIDNIDDYVIIKKSENVPSYARLLKDGSCRYIWRNVISNGIENDSKVYPFTNGAFYVTQQINFFLRRQDPNFSNIEWHNGNNDYTPIGEDINDYPNFTINDKYNFETNEINKPC